MTKSQEWIVKYGMSHRDCRWAWHMANQCVMGQSPSTPFDIYWGDQVLMVLSQVTWCCILITITKRSIAAVLSSWTGTWSYMNYCHLLLLYNNLIIEKLLHNSSGTAIPSYSIQVYTVRLKAKKHRHGYLFTYVIRHVIYKYNISSTIFSITFYISKVQFWYKNTMQ